nr:citrate synthase/methylcitrate synthase [uncultured Cohaesibacter sp.]
MNTVTPPSALSKHHISPGLDDVIVAETTLSHVDGAAGELILRGRRMEDVAGQIPFEDVVADLWSGFTKDPVTNIRDRLGAASSQAMEIAHLLEPLAPKLDVIEWMRACLDALPSNNSTSEPVAILAALPVFLANGFRAKQGMTLVPPNPDHSFAENILTMLHDEPPSSHEVESLDRYLVTICDHGLNASTFTARVIASTQSDMRSAISGAIGALKGPLHGGAPGPVLDMIEAIGKLDKADAWIASELAAGRRLMGFGHRIYRVRDPRADILKEGLAKMANHSDKIKHAMAIEQAALKALKKHKPGRTLDTNVEFYTAILLDSIGIDRTLFTPLFAVGRTAGWTAHVMEQNASNKLIRPQSLYVGPTPA